MFFPERIISIKDSDRVMEIGPGAISFQRFSDFFELNFDNDKNCFLIRRKTIFLIGVVSHIEKTNKYSKFKGANI